MEMKKLYEKSELAFALCWIGVYCLLQSLANPLNRIIGVEGAANAVFNAALSAFLLAWLRKNGLLKRYGLCRPSAPARDLLWYLPLAALASGNLWNGAAGHMPPLELACYLFYMLWVGLLEELLIRGFLFRAIARDSVRQAVVITSVTFGLGHLLNMVNGSGMALGENLFQVCYAVAIGFLFAAVMYWSGSLLPCVLTHSAINMLGAFANMEGLSIRRRLLMAGVEWIIMAAYALYLWRRNRNRPHLTFSGRAV